MNERFFKLALQAMDFHGAVDTDTELKLTNDELKKFAELIVRECAEICKKQEYKYWRSSEEDHWTPIDSANAIEQHFGVE